MIAASVLVEVELYRIMQKQKIRERFAEIRASHPPAPLDGYAWLNRHEEEYLNQIDAMLERLLQANDVPQ